MGRIASRSAPGRMALRLAPVLLLVAGIAAVGACSGSRGPEAPDLEEVGEGVFHPLGRGETLWELSQRYGVPLERLLRANRIEDPRRLAVGTRIFVPGAERVLAASDRPRIAPLEPVPRGCDVDDDVRVGRQARARSEGAVAFEWPLRGRITTCFAPIDGRPHDGIDIAVPFGTPVRAAERGRVIFADALGAYGNLVVVQHGGAYTSLYAHNARNLAQPGDEVAKGQVIAEAGDSGNATGSHLHFEIRVERRPDNPILYLP